MKNSEKLKVGDLIIVLKKSNSKCAYCNCEVLAETFECDHIIPVSKYGVNIDNIAISCKSCNIKKGNKTSFDEELKKWV